MRALLVLALAIAALPALAGDQPDIPNLVKSLASPDAAEARTAADALARIGQPALAELRRAAQSGDPALSAAAREAEARFWTPDDLVPADAAGALREIREQHDRLAESGDEKGADELARRWTELRTKVADFDVRTARGESPEVHAVGFDRGRVEGTRGERAEVEVSRTGAPVVLVLTGRERVRWDVRVAEGAELKMVVVTGPVSQVVRGVPDSVPVIRRIGTERSAFAHATSAGDEGWDDFATQAAEWTGGEVLSLQGGSEYDGTPVQVGEANPQWRFRRIQARVAKLHAEATAGAQEARRRSALGLRFPAAVHVLDQGDGIGAAEFTPAQVIRGTLRRSPRPMNHLALDGEIGILYAVSSKGVFQLDRECRGMEELQVRDDDDIPAIDRPCGVAFDVRRRRVAVISSGGSGIFYLYDPAERRWSATASLRGRDLSGLAFAPRADAFYSLEIPAEARESSTLARFAPDGSPAGTLRLSRPFPCGSRRPEQVACVETPDAPDGARYRLVLLGAPVAAPGGGLVRHCFVVEPDSGRVELACEQDARMTGE